MTDSEDHVLCDGDGADIRRVKVAESNGLAIFFAQKLSAIHLNTNSRVLNVSLQLQVRAPKCFIHSRLHHSYMYMQQAYEMWHLEYCKDQRDSVVHDGLQMTARF